MEEADDDLAQTMKMESTPVVTVQWLAQLSRDLRDLASDPANFRTLNLQRAIGEVNERPNISEQTIQISCLGITSKNIQWL